MALSNKGGMPTVGAPPKKNNVLVFFLISNYDWIIFCSILDS